MTHRSRSSSTRARRASSSRSSTLGDDARAARVFRGPVRGSAAARTRSPSRTRSATAPASRWTRTWTIAPAGSGTRRRLIALCRLAATPSEGRRLAAVGHRVVHGGLHHARPVLVDDALLDELEALVPLAPCTSRTISSRSGSSAGTSPDLPQVACFDTAFHRTPAGDRAALRPAARDARRAACGATASTACPTNTSPRCWRRTIPRLAEGRVIVAHLGNGASLCALEDGASVATTMGFSALDGLPMGTRCGAIDPGVVFYMIREMELHARTRPRSCSTRSPACSASPACRTTCATLREKAPSDADARAGASTCSSTGSCAKSARSPPRSAASTRSSSRPASARTTRRPAPR